MLKNYDGKYIATIIIEFSQSNKILIGDSF